MTTLLAAISTHKIGSRKIAKGSIYEVDSSIADHLISCGVARRTMTEPDGAKIPSGPVSISGEPLVSCICPTRNRHQMLARAIEYWKAQTYKNLELVIADDSEEPYTKPVPPGVRYYRPSRMSIGGKRNWLCHVSAGPLIAHWDDDDYSAPERIAEQVKLIQSCGAEVVGFHSMVFEKSPKERWMYRKDGPYAIGTSLMYKREFWARTEFHDIQVGEDNAFVAAANSSGALVSVDANGLMKASIHKDNTSPRDVKGEQWSKL